MSSKSYRTLHDFVRHGSDLYVICGNGHCNRHGVVGAHDAVTWFRLHRFTDSLTGALGRSAHDHFRCTRCGSKAGSIRPTENAVTVTSFFPTSPDAWRKLAIRLRD